MVHVIKEELQNILFVYSLMYQSSVQLLQRKTVGGFRYQILKEMIYSEKEVCEANEKVCE